MAKSDTQIRMRTWGIYNRWDSVARELPRIVEVTTRIPAVVDIEFGFVVRVRGAKNQKLHYCIDHPGIRDGDGSTRSPFDGSVYVRTNDWDFYLGDSIWEPITDKLGDWHMSVSLKGSTVAEKTFHVSPSTQ